MRRSTALSTLNVGHRTWAAAVLSLGMALSGCHDPGQSETSKATPTVTWSAPAAVTYGTALSGTQLDATASVPGSFVYSPAAGTVLAAGTTTLSVAFTPADPAHYNSATASVPFIVNKATPIINWPTPAPIAAGTALGDAELDATASVAGSFMYSPAAGTTLDSGTHTLSATFTPTDTADYTDATASVSLTVNAAAGIGPGGGTVTGFYGASVTVPAGALSANVDVEIPRDSSNAPALPSTGIDTSGAMYALTPHGTAFLQPVTVRIPFDSDRIPTDATPVIYKAEVGGAFAPIPTTVDGGYLSAQVSNFSWVIPGYAATLPRMVYALTSSSAGGTSTISVSSLRITAGTGALASETSSAPVGSGAISVTVHPSRRFAYVTNGTRQWTGTAANVSPNSLSVYQLDAVTGNISGPSDTKSVNGNPVSAVVHPSGKFVYVVNDVSSGPPLASISVFSIDAATGALSGPVTTGALGGAAVPSAIAFVPSGEFAYVTYQNSDIVDTFAVNHLTGELVGPIGSAPTGDGPRAMVITPGGRFGYVVSLTSQGSTGQLASYSIDQSTGVMTLTGSATVSSANGEAPLSLAMDPLGRFLYLGLQSLVLVPPSSNDNIEVFRINAGNGALGFAAGAATSSFVNAGPISVVAEPQGQFLYAMDGNNQLSAFEVGASGTLTLASATGGVFEGGASGGVGDPFFFAASGTSPQWQDGCTILVDNAFVFDGCPILGSEGGPGTGGSGPPPPPAANFVLTVHNDPAWGGSIISSPAGINVSSDGTSNLFEAAFPSGTTVALTVIPPSSPAVDVAWTGSGGCGGDSTTVVVSMTQDQNCYLQLTPTSTR